MEETTRAYGAGDVAAAIEYGDYTDSADGWPAGSPERQAATMNAYLRAIAVGLAAVVAELEKGRLGAAIRKQAGRV